jgi:hypothetical protein
MVGLSGTAEGWFGAAENFPGRSYSDLRKNALPRLTGLTTLGFLRVSAGQGWVRSLPTRGGPDP